MARIDRRMHYVVLAIVIAGLFLAPLSVTSQDLVTFSSLTGGSSVFVFRNSARAAKQAVVQRPTRSKVQRLESVSRLKRQYETLAKLDTRRVKAKILDPKRLPFNVRTLPAEQGARLFAGVGEYYLAQGQYQFAEEFFRDALSLVATNKEANQGLSESLAMKGNQLLVADKPDLAKAIFIEALTHDPLNAAANFGLGEVYSELNQTVEAIAAYEKSLASDQKLTEIYVPLGILYYQTGEIAKADDLLSKALRQTEKSAQTHFFLGLVRAAQGRNADALSAFQQAKAMDPKYTEAFYNSAEILSKDKRYPEAIADYKRAVELKPLYLEAWVALGDAYFENKQFPEAVDAYKTAVKLKNDNWEIYTSLADAQREAGAFNDAAGTYNLAIFFMMKDPQYSKAKLADIQSKMGFSIGRQCDIDSARAVACRWPSAIKSLQAAADITNDPLDHVNLGWAYFRVAHPDAELKNMTAAMPNLILAKAALEKALSGKPEVADYARQNLAAVLIDMGDQSGAIDTLKKLIERRPKESFLRYQLGVAYYKRNDFSNSEKAFRQALDEEPSYVAALTGLGEALIAKKDGKEARKVIDRLRPMDANAAARLDAKVKLARL
jgi:tetratricopeptide (TPR) repeat protein